MVVEHGAVIVALERGWRFLARDNVAVPAILNCDVALVQDEDDLHWLRGFDSLLADPARLVQVEPFQGELLFGLALGGWW